MNDYVANIKKVFEQNSDPENARGQEAYMRNQFEFYGIPAPKRKEIQKQFLTKTALPPKPETENIVKTLWNLPQREFQYFGLEFLYKYRKQFEKKDLSLFEWMITHKSWWDTVDFIAPKLCGHYFLMFPQEVKTATARWVDSGNLWLQRSALLFQLNYKEKTDTELLSSLIRRLTPTDEFFINKAVGWILRNYGKVNPQWVKSFADKTPLSPLSRKEALRNISG